MEVILGGRDLGRPRNLVAHCFGFRSQLVAVAIVNFQASAKDRRKTMMMMMMMVTLLWIGLSSIVGFFYTFRSEFYSGQIWKSEGLLKASGFSNFLENIRLNNTK